MNIDTIVTIIMISAVFFMSLCITYGQVAGYVSERYYGKRHRSFRLTRSTNDEALVMFLLVWAAIVVVIVTIWFVSNSMTAYSRHL